MMNLEQYFCKTVSVVSMENKEYTGKVDVYLPPNDNDCQEGIGITCGVWLDEEDIKSIKIID